MYALLSFDGDSNVRDIDLNRLVNSLHTRLEAIILSIQLMLGTVLLSNY